MKRYLNQGSPELSFPNTENPPEEPKSAKGFKQAEAVQNDRREIDELSGLYGVMIPKEVQTIEKKYMLP